MPTQTATSTTSVAPTTGVGLLKRNPIPTSWGMAWEA